MKRTPRHKPAGWNCFHPQYTPTEKVRIQNLLDAACQAEEIFELDDLEAYARKLRTEPNKEN